MRAGPAPARALGADLRSRGQTGAEYLGVLLVVAAIITALVAPGPGQAIGDKLSETRP